MMVVPSRRWAWVIIMAVVPGCGRTPAPPAGTGAKEVVRIYYEGLVRQDWQQAYLALDPDSKQRFTEQEFTRLAQAYRRNLGFDPGESLVQSCEEKGTEAMAHIVLTGHEATKQRRFKDAVVLRKCVDGWRVVLPSNFGK